MNPKHTDQNIPRHIPENKKRGIPAYEVYARAPYNFVPLPEKVVTVSEPPDHDHYEGNTGYIECELVTQSPLYVRGLMTQTTFEAVGEEPFYKLSKDQKQERAKFFILRDNEPVIPGSSLRGMIRALVEIVGYGKVQPVTKEPLVYRAVGDTTSLGDAYRARLMRDEGKKHYTPLMQAGYLEEKNGRWVIRPAQNIGGTTFARILREKIPEGLEPWHNCKKAHPIWVKLGKYDYQPVRGGFLHIKYTPVEEACASATPGFQEAVLAYSGKMNNKEREAVVFPPDPMAEPITIEEDLIRAFKEQISQEQQKLLGSNGALVPNQPVFYLMEKGKLVFFGHLWMFRLPYLRTANDFVPEHLRRESDLDLAEALFGYTKSDTMSYGKQRAYASRVFVSDAVLEAGQGNVWLIPDNEILTPRILSSPKPTTFQHYLVQGNDTAHEKKNLKHYASETPAETVIRGHKLYWHKGDVSRQDIELEKDKDRQQLAKQLTGGKPVRAGVHFKFCVYFENLNDAELGALLWVLALPEGYCQSLGMGKPLGMGAVKITPTLFLSNRNLRYTRLFENGKWANGFYQETDSERFTRAFETFMLSKMDVADKGSATAFSKIERIQMLLKMLEFPGPDHDWTRYMEIERKAGYPDEKVNEFKERPVLPDPLHIVPAERHESRSAPKPSASAQGCAAKPSASQQQQRTPKTSAVPVEKKQPAPSSSPKTAAPANPYKVGDMFNGTVRQILKDGTCIIEVPKLTYPKGYARVAKRDAAGKGWREGSAARCEIMRIEQDEKGCVVLYCRAGAKREMKK